MVEPKRS